MRRSVSIAILAVIALLSAAVNHAAYACAMSGHAASAASRCGHTHHQSSPHSSQHRPACCQDPTSVADAIVKFARDDTGASAAPWSIIADIAGDESPITARFDNIEHPPRHSAVRSHLFLKKLLI
jgi:hypothetical protein